MGRGLLRTRRDAFGLVRGSLERDQFNDVIVGLGEDNGWRRAFWTNGEELDNGAWGESKRGDGNTSCSFYNVKEVLESTRNAVGKMGQFLDGIER